ncbi:FIG00732525: hypothetical protein [Klebsiella pneumoniae ISC21]|nr:FIG00732525: hypothetical protein [Klebsiella pneumoniae ISC21]
MAIGIFVCSGSLLVGALAGASLNRFIPEHFKKNLTVDRRTDLNQYGHILCQ